MVQNQNPSLPDAAPSSSQEDPFDVVVIVRSWKGNHLFSYYPKAGVIEIKRNKVWSQITLQELVERGLAAVEARGQERLQVSLENSQSVRGEVPVSVDE